MNLMNVYNDDQNSAMRLLQAQADHLPSHVFMGGDFNCRSSVWDPEWNQHHTWVQTILDFASDLSLDLSLPQVPGPTHIPFAQGLNPTVIDLVFVPIPQSLNLRPELRPNLQGPSDHIPMALTFPVNPVRTGV